MIYLALIISYAAVIIEAFGQQRGVILIPYAIINPLILLLPRISYFAGLKKKVTREWLRVFERLGLLTILINAPASLWWHDMGFQYDRFLHFFAALIGAIAIALIVSIFSHKHVLFFTSFISILSLFIWEGVQFLSDRLFGTLLFHDAVQPITVDFTEDILFGLAGVIVALFILREFKILTRIYNDPSKETVA